MEGVIFSDYGTDLGSGPTVPGRFLYSFDPLFIMFYSWVSGKSHLSRYFSDLVVWFLYFPSSLSDPAGARLKPGSGYGYGFGIRVDSPLGPLRLEYAFNDRQAKRFHFGVGHRNWSPFLHPNILMWVPLIHHWCSWLSSIFTAVMTIAWNSTQWYLYVIDAKLVELLFGSYWYNLSSVDAFEEPCYVQRQCCSG